MSVGRPVAFDQDGPGCRGIPQEEGSASGPRKGFLFAPVHLAYKAAHARLDRRIIVVTIILAFNNARHLLRTKSAHDEVEYCRVYALVILH